MRENFVRWSRSGPFMHSVNHPKITVQLDIARMLLSRTGLQIMESGIIPHDNLTNGPVFPLYPEIGARLGVAGSYNFKGGGSYRAKDLKQFVSESFTVYRSAGDEGPDNEAFFPILEKARHFMESIR